MENLIFTIAALTLICIILVIALTVCIHECIKLKEENLMYQRTIQAQNNIRNSCVAAYQAMLREANHRR